MNATDDQIQYELDHASQSLTTNYLAALIAGLALAYIAVPLRCYARWKSQSTFGKDDALIIIALIPLSAYAVCDFYAISLGAGKHIIFSKNLEAIVKTYVVDIVSYALTVMLIKISMLCFYCRIFRSKRLVHISWAIGIFIVVYNTILSIATCLQCVPFSAIWTGKPGKCINILAANLALGSLNIFTDFVILVLPIPFTLQLQMNKVRKIQICGIFLTGTLACVFSIARLVAIGQALPGDQTYNQVFPAIFTFCEMSIGIVAACLPMMGIFFTQSERFTVIRSLRHRLSSVFEKHPKSRSTQSLDGTNSPDRKSSKSDVSIWTGPILEPEP